MNMSLRIKLPATQFASRQTVGTPILSSRVSPLGSRRPLARKVLAVQTEEKTEQTESKPEIAKVQPHSEHLRCDSDCVLAGKIALRCPLVRWVVGVVLQMLAGCCQCGQSRAA